MCVCFLSVCFIVPVDFDVFCCFCFVFVVLFLLLSLLLLLSFLLMFLFLFLFVFVLLVVGKCRWAPVLLRAARCCLELWGSVRGC